MLKNNFMMSFDTSMTNDGNVSVIKMSQQNDRNVSVKKNRCKMYLLWMLEAERKKW